MNFSNIFISLLVLSSQSLIAASFDEADELFDRRGESTEIIEKAASMYETLLAQASDKEDAIYAVEQIARLLAYRAQIIPESDIRQRKPFLERCLSAVAQISPKKIKSTTVEYLYWQGSCSAQYSEASGVTRSLRMSKEVHKTLVAGRKLDSTYHGGGFDRILGAMYTKLPSLNPFGPAGDLKLAKTVLYESLNSAAYETEIDPAYGTGNYFFETFYLLADVYKRSGEHEKARQVIDQAVARIDRGDYSPYREPETLLAKKRMLELRP